MIINNRNKSWGYMLVAATSIAVSGFFAKICMVNYDVPLMATVFSRFSIPFFILMVIKGVYSNSFRLSCVNLKSHILRAIFLTTSQILLFISMRKLSLSEATILYSTGPLFITLFDIKSGKMVSKLSIVSLIIGAIGVCLMMEVQKGQFNNYVLVGLLSGFCLSVSQILLYKCSQKESSVNVMFFVYLFTSIISAILFVMPLGHNVGVAMLHMDTTVLLFIICVGLFSLSNQFFRGKAYSLVSAPSSLSPLIYFSVFVSVLLDIIYFHHLPTLEVFLGSMLTIFGSFLITIDKGKP